MIKIYITDFEAYCRTQLNLSENSLRAYRQDLATFLKFLTHHPDTDQVNPDCLIKYKQYLQEVIGSSPSTIRRRFVTLQSYFKWLCNTGEVTDNPFNHLKLELRIPKRLPRPIDRPTLARLFHASRHVLNLELDTDRYFHSKYSAEQVTGLVLRLLVVTGMRIGEVTRLRVQDIFGGGSQIRVHGKGSRERTVYVTNQRLLTDFQHYYSLRYRTGEVSDHLFLNSRGARLSEATFRKRLHNLSRKLCIAPHLTPHRFRHSAATLLIEEGVDIRLVQRLLGHASISTTEIYTKVSDTSLIQAMEKADTLAQVET